MAGGTQQELEQIEQRFQDGVTSTQLFELLGVLGVKLSEPTFRKYVQLGLLPRSKRVGQKGKHKGSQGIYPVSTIRRILEIKTLMEEDLTLEDIASRVLRFRSQLEQLEETLENLVTAFLEELRRQSVSEEGRRSLAKEIEQLERMGGDLLARATSIEARLSSAARRPTEQQAAVITLQPKAQG